MADAKPIHVKALGEAFQPHRKSGYLPDAARVLLNLLDAARFFTSY
jgi:hypothetical protein